MDNDKVRDRQPGRDIDGERDLDLELAGKVDALIGKHLPAGDDRNIPVLTDEVDDPEWALADGAPAAPASPAVEPLHHLDDRDIDQLAQEIHARVFERIDREFSARLEQRLTAQLNSQISAAINLVLGDLRQELANEVGDAVTAVLADHLRNK